MVAIARRLMEEKPRLCPREGKSQLELPEEKQIRMKISLLNKGSG